MPYCIGFEIMNLRKLVTAEATTARQALLVIDQVQTRHQELKFIRSPQEGEIGVEMLRLLAKEENEELGHPEVRSSYRLRAAETVEATRCGFNRAGARPSLAP